LKVGQRPYDGVEDSGNEAVASFEAKGGGNARKLGPHHQSDRDVQLHGSDR